jgi:competence ComEA-like helix-hairpin-helix protein
MTGPSVWCLLPPIDDASPWRAVNRCGSRASVLVGLLRCLALLSVLVIGVLHRATVDLRVVHNYGDVIQAHYLAVAGVEKAKALLYHDASARRGRARNHTGDLYDAPREFKDVPLGRGQFRVFYQSRREEGGDLRYGVTDEESRLHLNVASAEELGKLDGMTTETAAAIMDWRDSDNNVTPGGAEAEYYASLQPPYLPRNGPFQSTRELMMVRGVTPELFAGEDANQNGLLDPEEDDGNDNYPPDNRDGVLDAGWSGVLTVHSSVRDVNAAGEARVNVQSADESSLSMVRGISAELAKAIVAYRNQNKIESLADLLEVTAVREDGQAQPRPNQPGGPAAPGAPPPGVRVNRPPNSPAPQPVPAPGGPKLVSEEQLLEMADELTTSNGREQAGAINVNTASPEVLACLPGLTPQLAQAIVSYRRSIGFLPNIAWLLKVPGMNRAIFKQVSPRLTARSETFRILSEGQVTGTGARQRVQVIVHLGPTDIETLSYREDL